MSVNPRAASNKLLMRLNSSDRERLDHIFERVPLEQGQTLSQAGAAVQHVYFPLSGFLSLVLPMEGGIPEVETVCVGDEGMVSVNLVLGITFSSERVLVQVAGEALRSRVSAFEHELASNVSLRATLELYLYVVKSELAQNIACSHHHLLEARFARWLLIARDRCRSNEIPLTQEFLANMLGVHRPAVSVAVGLMQKRGAIANQRGLIVILDRAALESMTCPCYGIQKETYERFLGASSNPSGAAHRIPT